MARESGLGLSYVGCGEEYKRLPEVASLARDIVLPVRFPEAPEVEDDAQALGVTLEQLRAWDEAPRNPLRVHEAGMRIAFTAQGLEKTSEFRRNVARAVEQGLPAEAALAAVTVNPAAMAGLSGRLGTVEAGKIANLVVADGDVFDTASRIREVWIDGRRYEIDPEKDKEKP
jgi:hypothetical protein